jgi:hypothetical protein
MFGIRLQEVPQGLNAVIKGITRQTPKVWNRRVHSAMPENPCPLPDLNKCVRLFLSVVLLCVLGVEWSRPARAFTVNSKPLTSTQKNIETLGTGIAIALPLTAGGIALYKNDKKGLVQLVVESALTVGTAYALKNIVRERRPDGSDYQSFPSDTTALAASGSSFVWGRYGWEYGLPATALTQFVSYILNAFQPLNF